MENSILRKRMTRMVIPACTAFLLAGGFASCTDTDNERLEGQPSWLNGSIYSTLQERGNFTQTLKLIDSQTEDFKTILDKTGSRTLFVADDEAWNRFFKSNSWGVSSIEEMSAAQRALLFQCNTLNSAYLIDQLSNLPAEDANTDVSTEGACMRHVTGLSLTDTIPVMTRVWVNDRNQVYPEVNPIRTTDYWARLRDKEQAYVMQDNTVPTMMHFMPKFMLNNNITSDDVAFLTNGNLNSNESSIVNGQTVVEGDVVCQNGYIDRLGEVGMPLDNMANVIAQHPEFSIYKRILNRFCYPSYYTRVNNAEGGVDSIYVRRYFSQHQNHEFKVLDDGTKVPDGLLLKFDPGWNQYQLPNTSGMDFKYDAAVMLVPTDQAMLDYLENDGADLKERYGNAGPGATAWDNAPDNVVIPLLNNTMLTSLKAAMPSSFATINNTAGERMGVKKSDIDETLWANNGVIYKTNKVYVAPEYVSVYYPCVIRADGVGEEAGDLSLTHLVVENDNQVVGGEGFKAYLSNMGSKYTFIIPTDNALQTYFDPVSYKRKNTRNVSTAVAYKFRKNDAGYIAADPYLVDWTTLDDKGRGTIADVPTTTVNLSTSTSSEGDVFNHFKDILNTSLCVDSLKGMGFVPGQRFYMSKGGSPVVVDWNGTDIAGVAGSFQYERQYYVPVVESYDKRLQGNGQALVIDEEPLMTTFLSPYAAIRDVDKADHFGSYGELLSKINTVALNDGASHVTMDTCLTNLNNYHYTIYIPTNEAVDAMTAAHKLPTWEDVSKLEDAILFANKKYDEVKDVDETEADRIYEDVEYLTTQMQYMQNAIANFVNYHIQDNSVFVNGPTYMNKAFETSCLDTLTNRFVKLRVTQDGSTLQVEDNAGNMHYVVTAGDDAEYPAYYNVLARQYYFNGNNLRGTSCSQIYSSAYAVIHQIDGVLMANKGKDYYYDPTEYTKVMNMIDEKGYYGSEEVKKHNSIKRKR